MEPQLTAAVFTSIQSNIRIGKMLPGAYDAEKVVFLGVIEPTDKDYNAISSSPELMALFLMRWVITDVYEVRSEFQKQGTRAANPWDKKISRT